jgi:hypothetical protein
MNVGIDLALFNNRIEFTAEWYKNKSTDLLHGVPVPANAGVSNTTVVMNAASMTNTGVEFSLTYRNYDHPLKHQISANFSTLSNEVTALSTGQTTYFPENDDRHITIVGQPVGQFYGYVYEGIARTQDQLDKHAAQPGAQVGDCLYKDLNGDNVINDQEHKNLIDNNNQNIQIIDNFLDKKNLNRQKDDYKDEKDIKDKQQEIKNRNKIINEEVNINKENLEDINQMFNDILHNYFFNENESFKVIEPTKEELDSIKVLFNSILKNNNYDIKKLKEYQNNYIEKEISQNIKNSTRNHRNAINGKIEKIKKIISQIETNK